MWGMHCSFMLEHGKIIQRNPTRGTTTPEMNLEITATQSPLKWTVYKPYLNANALKRLKHCKYYTALPIICFRKKEEQRIRTSGCVFQVARLQCRNNILLLTHSTHCFITSLQVKSWNGSERASFCFFSLHINSPVSQTFCVYFPHFIVFFLLYSLRGMCFTWPSPRPHSTNTHTYSLTYTQGNSSHGWR